MGKTVKWGVLGAADFARNFMAPAIHEAQGARLAALATSSPEKAEGFLAFCPDLAVHPTYEALLADPGIDAVYIPLPNHLHVEWTLKALEAGKHVLTEKPIAMQAREIDALIAAARQHRASGRGSLHDRASSAVPAREGAGAGRGHRHGPPCRCGFHL